MKKISLVDALGRGLRTGFFFGLLVGIQEGLSAVTITRARTGDVSITGLSKLAHVFFTPVLADALLMALVALVPALALWFWQRRSTVATEQFDSLLAGLAGGGAMLIFAAFRSFPVFSMNLLLKIDGVFSLLRLGGAALLAGVAFQVLFRRYAGRVTLPALVLTAITITLPALPVSYWGFRNEDHPLGGNTGFYIGLTVSVVVFCLLTLLLRRLLGSELSRRRAIRWWFILAAAGLVAGTFLPLAFMEHSRVMDQPFEVPGDRNVVLYTVDTLRGDALDLDDPDSSLTPNLARLAAAGTRFDDVQAQCPWTLPSICSMMTAIHPSGQGVVSSRQRLDSARRTLAEEMAAAGYLTQAVVCNAWLTDSFGLNQGFEFYNHVWEEGASEYWENTIWVRIVRRFKPGFLVAPDTHNSAEMVDRAINFLQQNAESNFFLWVHVIDPHDPYAPLGRFRALAAQGYEGRLPPTRSGNVNKLRRGRRLEAEDRRHLRRLYDLEVQYTDEQFGRLMDTLEDLDLLDNTLVVFTSDHGEEFWDHENVGHGHTLFDELTHVPLIIKPPEVPAVQQVSTQVRLIDMAPTILDLLGLPPMAEGQGSSLLPLMEGAVEDHRTSFSEALIYFGEKKSVDDGRFRLILSANSGTQELFDLEADPGATHDVSDQYPEVVTRLKEALRDHLREQQSFNESLEKNEENGESKIDDRMKARLRALGYLQ